MCFPNTCPAAVLSHYTPDWKMFISLHYLGRSVPERRRRYVKGYAYIRTTVSFQAAQLEDSGAVIPAIGHAGHTRRLRRRRGAYQRALCYYCADRPAFAVLHICKHAVL